MQKIIAFMKRPNSLHILINTLGNYFNVFFTALTVYILVRILSPAEYGVFSVLMGISYVLANILDLGTSATIYSYLPQLLAEKSPNVNRFIKSTFFYQSFLSIIVIVVLCISFPFLDKVFFKTGASLLEMYLTAFAVLFFIWQNFVTNCMFAAKKFLRANIYINISNIIKTAILFVVIGLHFVNMSWIIFVYGMGGPIIFFILLFFEKKHLALSIARAPVHRDEFRFKYTLTYFLAAQFQNMGQRTDLFLLSYFQLKDQTGYYGLAQKIILTVITTVVSITQVLSPSFSQTKTKEEARHHLKTGFLYLLAPTTLFIILAVLPQFVFSIFFTHKFDNTAGITHALSVPYIIYALANLPLLFLLYTVKKPRYILIANIIFFVLVTLGCFILIPQMGMYGPPLAIGVALFASTLVMGAATISEYKKLPER